MKLLWTKKQKLPYSSSFDLHPGISESSIKKYFPKWHWYHWIFKKKKFEIWCQMMGCNHSWGISRQALARVGVDFVVLTWVCLVSLTSQYTLSSDIFIDILIWNFKESTMINKCISSMIHLIHLVTLDAFSMSFTGCQLNMKNIMTSSSSPLSSGIHVLLTAFYLVKLTWP